MTNATLRETDWLRRAACHGQSSLMFPDNPKDAARAKAICNGSKTSAPCPVKTECLAYAKALENVQGNLQGIWGGQTF